MRVVRVLHGFTRFRASGAREPTWFRVSGFGFRVSGLGFRVSGLGFRVSGFGFRVSGFGLMVSGLGSTQAYRSLEAWG